MSANNEVKVEGSDDVVDVIDWQARATKAESTLVKEKELRKAAQQAAKDAAAGKDPEDGKNYKDLFAAEKAAKDGLLGKVKSSAIAVAAQARLAKAGVSADAIGAATKLLDQSMIEWDEEEGVDETSIVAAVQSLKTAHPFLFEKKVGSNKPAPVSDKKGGAQADDKTMSREEFDALDALTKSARMRGGWKIAKEGG